MLSENIYYIKEELLDNYYDKNTGFKRSVADDISTVML